jgi:hypothetical protein
VSDASEFVLVSNWRVHAPRERVWRVLRETRAWPAWWRYVVSVDELEPGDEHGVGALQRYRWSSRLPYGVTFAIRTVEVRRAERIRARSEGDLAGEGTWDLRDDGDDTRVTYTWRVALTKGWMRALAPLLRPVFTWNHNAVMAAGEAGLNAYLSREAPAGDAPA